MNREIRDLLVEAEVVESDSLDWPRVLLFKNRGGIPPGADGRGDFAWNRGFNLLLLGRASEPTHFCKCRPANDEKLKHEAMILSGLSEDPQLAGVVPRTHLLGSARIQIQISEFVPGTLLSQRLSRMAPTEWTSAADAILSIAHRVSERAKISFPWLLGAGSRRLEQEAAWALEHLAAADLLETPQRASLEEALRGAESVPSHLQHGDLWHANIIRSHSHWVLVDFEDFARVQVPLYDVFHFLRTAAAARAGPTGAEGGWLARLAAPSAASAIEQRALRLSLERYGLAREAVTGALIFYLIDMAARIHRRGTPAPYWEPLLTELRTASEMLRSGTALHDVLLG